MHACMHTHTHTHTHITQQQQQKTLTQTGRCYVCKFVAEEMQFLQAVQVLQQLRELFKFIVS